jgi:hypothetical protein
LPPAGSAPASSRLGGLPEHRGGQGGLAAVVDPGRVGAVLEQDRHGLRVIVVRREDQQRVALAVGQVRRHPGRDVRPQLAGRAGPGQVEHPMCVRDRLRVQVLGHA